MNKSEECKYGYWEETLEDAYWVCEKGIYDCENCKEFEKPEDIKIDYYPSSGLQGCTIYFKDIKDLKIGDTFVLKKMSRSSTGGIYDIELQKIYLCKIGG